MTILPQTPPLDRDGVRRLARHGCLDIHQVEWVRGHLAPDGGRLLCWFQARDAESVRLVLRHQGWHEAAVWPAEVSQGDDEAALGGVSDKVIVEFACDSICDEEMTSTKTDLMP